MLMAFAKSDFLEQDKHNRGKNMTVNAVPLLQKKIKFF